MKKLLKVILLFILVLSWQGCGSASQTQDRAQGGSVLVPGAFVSLHSSTYISTGEYTNKRSEIFVDQLDYENELLNYSNETASTIDFTTNKVLLVDMGLRSSGGYSISVSKLEDFNQYALVTATLSVPGDNCGTASVLTNPFEFIQIATKKEVLIKEEIIFIDCTN